MISAQNNAGFFLNTRKQMRVSSKDHSVFSVAGPCSSEPFTPLSFYFLWFSSSHPSGCRNVETERFKNSILHSDSAAPVAPRYCAANSRNVKMATDLGELLVPYMPTIRVPRTGDRVFKSECAFSFDSPVSGRLPPSHTPPPHTHAVCLLLMGAREVALPVAIAGNLGGNK